MCIEIQYQKYLLSNKNKKFRQIRVQPDATIDFQEQIEFRNENPEINKRVIRGG